MQIIKSENDVILRLVNAKDSDFIYNLRHNSQLNTHLNKISFDIRDQIKFIEKSINLSKDGLEYYFIIEYKNIPVGTVRIYDIDKEKKVCTWGSFIIDKTKILQPCNIRISIISLYGIFDFVFNNLQFKEIHFDVRQKNVNIKNFYIKFGGEIIKEDDLDCYLIITQYNYEAVFLNLYKDELKNYLGRNLLLLNL